MTSVSCATAGGCTAAGFYTDGSGRQAFVVRETSGVWGSAVEVPGTATLNSGGDASVTSVSCATAGACTAGGSYRDGSSNTQAFVVCETNGVWGDAVEVPGTAALNSGGDASVGSVSCGAAGDCAAGGYYKDGSSHSQAFVVNYTSPCVVPHLVGKTLSAARKALAAAYCGLGRVRKIYAKAKRGHVVAQNRRAGQHLKHGAKVALTLSKGSRR